MKSATKALTVLVVAALLLALPSYAQALTVATDKASYIPGETVVVTGTAAPGATVSIGITNPDGGLADFKTVTAGSDGSYSATFKIPATIPTGGWTKLGTYTVKAQSGGHTATTTFKLALTAWVSGKVVDETGSPVEGATVKALETGAETTTDANGEFTLALNPGTYTLEVSKAGYVKTTITVSVSTGANDIGTIQITSLQAEIEALKANITSLENDLAALQSSLQGQLSNITDELSGLNNKLSSLDNKLSSLQSTLNTLSSKIDNTNSQLSDLKTKVDNLQTSINDLSSKIDNIKSSIDSLSTSVNDLKTSMNKLNSDMSSALNDVKSTVSGLRSDVQGLRQDVSSVSGKVDALSSDLGGKIDALTPLTYVTITFAVLAFIFALLAWLTVRRALAK